MMMGLSGDEIAQILETSQEEEKEFVLVAPSGHDSDSAKETTMALKTFRGHMTSNLREEEALTYHLSWNRACHPTFGYRSDLVAPLRMYRDHE